MMRKIKLYYTESEAKIILRSLIRLKNELIRQGRYADIVDEVILLLVDAKSNGSVPEAYIIEATQFSFQNCVVFFIPKRIT